MDFGKFAHQLEQLHLSVLGVKLPYYNSLQCQLHWRTASGAF